MDWLRTLHSLVRWLVIGVSLLGIVWFVLAMANRNLANAKLDRTVMLVFTSLIDTQVLLGIVFLIVVISNIGFLRHHGEHLAIMLVALVVAHLPMRWRKSDAPRTIKARNNLLVIVAVLVLVFVGVSMLPYNAWRLG
jgi:hypothetical protein